MGWTYFIILFLFAPKLEIRSSGFLWEGRSLFPLCQGGDVLFFGGKKGGGCLLVEKNRGGDVYLKIRGWL